MYDRLWRQRHTLFVPVPRLAPASPDTPFVTPQPEGKWYGDFRNHGLALHRELFGEAAHRQALADSFALPMPSASRRHRLDLTRQGALLGLYFSVQGARTGQRGTHAPGVSARGVIRMRSALDIPEHPFFRPGRTFACRLRHSNASFADDAALVIRGAALKFSDSDMHTPLDILMNTGATPAFYCPHSFMVFARGRGAVTRDDWSSQVEVLRRLPAFFVGAIGGMRAAPESYAQLSYYNQTIAPFRGLDGQLQGMRIRMVDPDLELESGLLSEAHQRRVHDQRRDADDSRPHDYLRTEFAERVRTQGVRYTLQIQLRPIEPDHDTHEVFNPMRLWPDRPWSDLADVELYAPLSDTENARTRFWPGNQAEGLGLFDGWHVRDYNALTWIRVHFYALAAAGRGAYLRRHANRPQPFSEQQLLR